MAIDDVQKIQSSDLKKDRITQFLSGTVFS